MRVCFVCTGNTCRSPMAAAVANALATEAWSDYPPTVREAITPCVVAFSRGLYANEGEPISQNAVLALEAAGVEACRDADYHAHTAKTVDEDDVRGADLMIAVSGRHANELLMRFPWAASRIACFPREIPDPWGGDLQIYRECLSAITEGVREMLFAKGESM